MSKNFSETRLFRRATRLRVASSEVATSHRSDRSGQRSVVRAWWQRLRSDMSNGLGSEHVCAPYGMCETWELVKGPDKGPSAHDGQHPRYVCKECGTVWRGVK